jgi:hypothetical protein
MFVSFFMILNIMSSLPSNFYFYFRLLVGFAVPISLLSDSPLRIPRNASSYSFDSSKASHGQVLKIIPHVPHVPNNFHGDSSQASRISQVTLSGSVKTQMTKQQREIWVQCNLPTAVQLQLSEPYGKDSQCQSFYGEIQFRHTLIFLLKSGFLSSTDRQILSSPTAYPKAALLYDLLLDHRTVDFSSLRRPIPATLSDPAMMSHWGRMFSACLLYYDLDVATAIRYCGGAHTGSHRQWSLILQELQQANVEQQIVSDLQRIFVSGCPGQVNVTSSDANFHAYLAYGNHTTVLDDPEATKAAFAKDVRRSYSIPANPLLSYFAYHMHLNPVGMVLPSRPNKKHRPIVDCSFHPEVWCHAVNDWTSTDTEPEIHFAGSFRRYLIWIHNLRISYPSSEIYPLDDDVSGAFRHCKFNPNVVGMHTFLLFGYLFFSSGQIFGGNTCPSNFEPIARARQQLAQYLWFQATTHSRVRQYLPTVTQASSPTVDEIRQFTSAESDSRNLGVFSPDGARKSPTYDHHVDDNLYADVADYLMPTIAASILALYLILGFPASGNRDVVSWDKFTKLLSHKRKCVGWVVDTRRLTVALPTDKCDDLLLLLNDWIQADKFTLREVAILIGHLGNATTVCRWMRTSYFTVQNTLRRKMLERHAQILFYKNRQQRSHHLAKKLPSTLLSRLDTLVSQEIAQDLWNWKQSIPKSTNLHRELLAIQRSLRTEHWEIFIPQMIPRDPHFHSVGDASQLAGGALSHDLHYWFVVFWSRRIRAGTKLSPKHNEYIHINCLEFIVVLLQVVATIVRLESDIPAILAAAWPKGFPAFPVLQSETDNMATKKWTNRVTTTSARAHWLVTLYGQLLQRSRLTVDGDWIAGKDNHVPDYISRPDLKLSPPLLRQQTFHKYRWIRPYAFFQPSPELCSILASCLFDDLWAAPPGLPENLGQFVPGESITSFSVTI